MTLARFLPLIALLAPLPALAAPTLVWTEPTVPDSKALGKAEAAVGPTTSLAAGDLAFPPQPSASVDDERYKALATAVANARAKWDDFEVEFGIATELEKALSAIDVIRDGKDADAMIEARQLQGAAVLRAFDPTDFETSGRAEPFRVTFPGAGPVNRPWMQALALDANHEIDRDHAEASTWSEFEAFSGTASQAADGTLDLAALPAGTKLVIDGVPLTSTNPTVPLRPGTHFVHALQNGKIAGRAKVDIAPKATTPLPVLVDGTELAASHSAVIAEDLTGLPADTKAALDAIQKTYGGPMFLGAVEDGKVTVVPYTSDAALIPKQTVTFNLGGELGFAGIVSPIFDIEEHIAPTTAPTASASLGFELGISYAAILGGCDVSISPAYPVEFGNAEQTKNISTFALPQPWGGVGVYALRPTGDKPYILVGGTYGWNAPANMAVGARATMGFPIGDMTWFKLTAGGSVSGKSSWDDDLGTTIPMKVFFLRLGVSSGLVK